jgi:Sulfotransferase family
MAIISFKHRFIFVKTMKTAGTSLEVHLAAHCGPEDIVTPIFPPNPSHVPRNFTGDGGIAYFNHMPASLIRSMQPRAFATFFKFCFERHPVEKCLSHFAMLKNSKHHDDPSNPSTWTEYLNRGDFPIDTSKYVDQSPGREKDKVIVDKIYRFEELDQALKDISLQTGIAYGRLRAREKAGFRSGAPSFEQVMGAPHERARIFHAFESSLRLTPYE